jgi:hypothetical protein
MRKDRTDRCRSMAAIGFEDSLALQITSYMVFILLCSLPYKDNARVIPTI